MILSLTGFMGCGKSTVGKEVSELLSWPLIDTDDYIQERAGRSISEIFAAEGEPAFRKMETDLIEELLCDYGAPDCSDEQIPGRQMQGIRPEKHLVLSLGGGAVTAPRCASLIHEKTLCIYLRATTQTLVNNLKRSDQEKRPMLLANSGSLKEHIEQLMSLRRTAYEAAAHLTIDTDGKPVSAIAKEILKLADTSLLK